jgi:hypothetical protein
MSFTLCLETLRNCSTALEKCADDIEHINNAIPSGPVDPGYGYVYWVVIFVLIFAVFGRNRM